MVEGLGSMHLRYRNIHVLGSTAGNKLKEANTSPSLVAHYFSVMGLNSSSHVHHQHLSPVKDQGLKIALTSTMSIKVLSKDYLLDTSASLPTVEYDPPPHEYS